MRRRSLLALALLCSVGGVRAADSPGGLIVYSRKEGTGYQLHIMKGDGTADHVVPGQTSAVGLFPTWSPDGQQIAFLSAPSFPPQQHQISVIGSDGAGLRVAVNNGQRSGLAAWSPDGKQLTYTSGETPGVYVSDTNGNASHQVNPAGSFAFASFWMPDGKRVGYSRFDVDAKKSRIVTANADGSGEETLVAADNMALAGPAAVSPDGKRMAYLVMDPEAKKGTVRTWDFANKSENILFEVPMGDGDLDKIALPAWSPDSKQLLLPLQTEKGVGLFAVSDDGKTRTRLTPEGVDCGCGSWRASR